MNLETSSMDRHFINSSLQQQLHEEYKAKNYAVINASREAGKPDSLEYTFNIEVLEQFLQYLKSQAQDQGVSNINVTICMAQYPEVSPDDRIKPAYNGYQSVFLKGVDADSHSDLANTNGLNFSNIIPPYRD